MSYVLKLSDEQYSLLRQVADAEGQTVEELFVAWTMEQEGRYRRAHPTHYETDDWFRHLGVSDEVIDRIKREVQEEAECPHDADT